MDTDKAEQRRVERMRVLRDLILTTWPDPIAILENLGSRLTAISGAGEEPQPGYLFDMVCGADEKLTRVAATYLVEHPDHPLASLLMVPLRRLRERDESAAIELADWAWDKGDDKAKHAVASLYGPAAWTQTVTAAEQRLLMKVVTSQLPQPESGIWAAQTLARADPDQAKAAVLAYAPSDRNQSEALSGVLAAHSLLFSTLTDDDLRNIVVKFVRPPDLDGGRTQAFLAAASARTPVAVIDMLVARIDAGAKESPVRYQPVPFPHPSVEWWSDLASKSRRDALRRIAEAALVSRASPSLFHVIKLFAWVTGDSAEDARAVIQEWAESGVSERIGVSVEVIAGARRELVYEHSGFVERILAAATASGAEPAALRAFRLAAYNDGPMRRVFASPDKDRQVRTEAAEAASKQTPGSALHRLYSHIEQHAAELEERTMKAREAFDAG